MIGKIVCTEGRLRQLHFPGVLYYGTSVFYTARNPSSRADALLREAPMTIFTFLLVSIAACVLFFCLFNFISGRKLLSDIEDAVLLLVSTAMLFSYPVPKRFKRVLAGRIVLFCWMAGGFSFAVYFQSLLTSSLSSGYHWDADDTLEKLYPKLESGRVLPCVMRNTYFERLLRWSDGKQDILGAMAAARRRSPDKDSTVSDTEEGCLDKVVRGGHVFVSADLGVCGQASYGNTVTRGKDAIHTLYGSTPMGKDSPLRDSYGHLLARIFETGWELRQAGMESWNCSRFGDIEVSLVAHDVRQFLWSYYVCCSAAAIVLAIEVLISRVF
ncbi:unnamed protein product [Ixodes persulcatus]